MNALGLLTRRELERREHETLDPRASFSDMSRGRAFDEGEEDEYRTAFQRDRDRILHSKAFRRLSHKTQVFLSPEGDHYRTRLTHTLEVSQIARTCARSLRLNEDLTEAIALGHDLGHTPFGHTGEGALNEAIQQVQASHPEQCPNVLPVFRHNEQSVRMVERLERGGRGLNLTREVVDGILCHTGTQRAFTLEGRIVAVADRIAYVNHDIDDAIRAGVIDEEDLPAQDVAVLGSTPSERIETMVQDLVLNTAKTGDVCMSPRVHEAMMSMRSFLFENVYISSDAKAEEPKANRLIQTLYMYYFEHVEEIPAEYRMNMEDGKLVVVADFIACMTDRYAIRTFEALMVPRSWARTRRI